MILRPYQTAAIEEIRAHLRAGKRRVCLVLSTGGGKTILAASMIQSAIKLGKKVIFVAHRKELVTQCSAKLDIFGVDHGIIMADHPRYRPQAPVQVASVQTLIKRLGRVQTPDLIFYDECFPAGTMVGNKRIETVRVGDLVPSFNEASGQLCLGRVTRVFRSKPMALVRVYAAGRSIVCTPGHPFWTQRGWVYAGKLETSDEIIDCGLLDVRNENSPEHVSCSTIPSNRQGLLLGQVHQQLQRSDFFCDDGAHESEICIGANAQTKSNAPPGDSRSGVGNAACHRPQAGSPRWQGAWSHGTSEETSRCASFAGLEAGICSEDGMGARPRISLHDRYREPQKKDGDRGGRKLTLFDEGTPDRCSQRRVPAWTRVDRVEVLEPASDLRFGYLCPDDSVYNLEVEGTHAYVADGFIVHNCHHVRSESAHRIIEAFPAASVIGLTATPWRLDGKGLGELFQELVVASTVRALIDLGSLVPAKGFTYEQPDLSGVRKSAGDYNQEQLDAVMAKVILTGHILEEWKAHAAGKRTVVFAVNIRHSQIIVEQFRAAGIHAEHVDAHTPQPIRDAILGRLRSGKTLVVSNVGILTEGWDMPACEVAVLARPTASVALAIQMMGRALRPWCFICEDAPGAHCSGHGVKTHARIHDHAGVILAHGQPADPRDYSLDDDKPPKPPPSKQCPQCYFVNPAGVNTCGECGYDFAAARQEGQRKNGVVEVSARRIEFDDSKPRPPPGEWTAEERTTLAQATPEQKAGEYLLLEVEARKRGFKKGWVGYRYKEMFGAWPNFTSEFLNSVPMPIEHLVRELERPRVDAPQSRSTA